MVSTSLYFLVAWLQILVTLGGMVPSLYISWWHGFNIIGNLGGIVYIIMIMHCSFSNLSGVLDGLASNLYVHWMLGFTSFAALEAWFKTLGSVASNLCWHGFQSLAFLVAWFQTWGALGGMVSNP